MNALFLLIILSQNAAGDINASFVNTGTLEQCRQKALMIEDVFATAQIPVIESRCIESGIRFTAYDHASSSTEKRYFYLLAFDETSVQVTAMRDWADCVKQRKAAGKRGRLYCGSSVQSIR